MKQVLIIGSGIAGLSCAIECGKRGISTILASPYASERAQSVMAAGGINAAVEGVGDRAGEEGTGDSVQCHIEDTLKGGVYLDDEEAVKGLCSEAPEIVNWLEQIGVVFTRDEKGAVDRRAFGGQTYSRTAYSGAATGKQIVTALVRQSRRYESEGLLERKFGFHFHSALIKDGVCYGALLFDMRKRCLTPVYADAVVIATGGQNKLYGKTTGSRLCDGYAAGKLFEQGVRLKNLEFVQYHPTSIETPQKRMLISEAARGEGGRLYYMDGDRRVYFMEDKFGPKGNLMPRDVVSRHIYDAPSQVYLDIAFLGAEKIHAKLEEVYELCKGYIGLDVTKESIPVDPTVHFFMGGIAVDVKHRTNIDRLYAVGECASIYHGANRLGGNSLLAALYSGRVAAGDINGLDAVAAVSMEDYVTECSLELAEMMASKSKFPTVYITNMLADTMNDCMGIKRHPEQLMMGIESIEYLLSVCDKLRYDSEVSVYENYSLRSLLLLAKAGIMSAHARTESRGAHFRADYPERNDEMNRPTIAEFADGEIKISI